MMKNQKSDIMMKRIWQNLWPKKTGKVMNLSIFKMTSGDKKRVSLSSGLKKLIFGIVCVVTVSFLISTYIITDKERREYGIRESENVLKTLSNNINSDMEKYISLSRLIMTEDRLVKFLRSGEDSVDIGMINDARYGIMDILNVTEGVDSVIVFREDLIMVATNRFTYRYDYDLMEQDSWREDIYSGLGRAVVSLNSNGVAIKSENKPVVTIGRAVYDIDSQERTGIMLMNISPAVFDRMLKRLGYRNICIMGTDGTFLAGNSDYAEFFDEKFLSEETVNRQVNINGEKTLLSGCTISGYPIVLIRASEYGTEGIPFRMLYILLFLLIVFLGVMFYALGFIRKNLTDPVFELSESMEQNRQQGELKKINVEMPAAELDMLEGDYNSMIDHVNELIDKLMEKEKTLQRAEMRVLQEQIKPHFLYNSIETIGFMALDSGAENVHDALETLGSFYRNFLSKGGREIPLSREVQIVKDYLSLQKLRYGDILIDEYDISEDTENYIVPKLILQPLVENCIYHGIRLKGEQGVISISSRLVDGRLHLKVRDTGVGMDAEQINRILSTERIDMTENDSDSFGLWGTIERVRFYTGRDDVVNIKSEIGEYTEVEFII